MKNFKTPLLFLGFAILIDCTGFVPPANYQNNYPSQGYNPNYPPPNAQRGYNPNYPPQQPNAPPRNDADYDRRITRDADRDETLSRRRKGRTCENENRNHECKQLCRTMYRRQNDREDCEELTIPDINKIFDIYEELENPRQNNLEQMYLDDLDAFLNISIAGFDRLISRYNKRDAKEVLRWLAENDDAAELVRDEDDDFETFEELLELLKSFERATVEKPFVEEIDNKTLLEHAMDAGNESAVEWFLDYIFQTYPGCDDNNDPGRLKCLTVMCKIGDGFEDEDSREDMLEYSDFESFIEDVIDNHINQTNWKNPLNNPPTTFDYPDVESLEEKGGDWVKALCDTLT